MVGLRCVLIGIFAASNLASQVGRDLEIATAVRLSATFPYVSPASRPDTKGRVLSHIADGGYYDNFGVFALIDWLNQALVSTDPLPEILILRIEAFPPNSAQLAEKPTGWPFQLAIPMATLSSVRGEAQTRRNDTELSMLQAHFKQLGGNVTPVLFRYAPPPGCNSDPPLSWDLTSKEIDCVDIAWSSELTSRSKQNVKMFLNQPLKEQPAFLGHPIKRTQTRK